MFRISKQKVRIAIVPMLLLLLVPSFGLVLEPVVPLDRETKVTVHPDGFNFSTFLKDNEEKENEEILSISFSVTLLDLTDHILQLQATHQRTDAFFSQTPWIAHPQPLILFCTFLI